MIGNIAGVSALLGFLGLLASIITLIASGSTLPLLISAGVILAAIIVGILARFVTPRCEWTNE